MDEGKIASGGPFVTGPEYAWPDGTRTPSLRWHQAVPTSSYIPIPPRALRFPPHFIHIVITHIPFSAGGLYTTMSNTSHLSFPAGVLLVHCRHIHPAAAGAAGGVQLSPDPHREAESRHPPHHDQLGRRARLALTVTREQDHRHAYRRRAACSSLPAARGGDARLSVLAPGKGSRRGEKGSARVKVVGFEIVLVVWLLLKSAENEHNSVILF